jgi:hypothetical protein
MIDAGGTDATAAAAIYRDGGYQPIPLPPESKAPRHPQWQEGGFTPQDFTRRGNIGLLLGTPGAGLVDVDLDSPEAVALAPRYLPPTGWSWGRKSSPRSHYLYLVDGDAGSTRRWQADGAVMLELRGGGGQTMAPPSVHPSGERVRNDESGPPARVRREELEDACAALADAVRTHRAEPADRPLYEYLPEEPAGAPRERDKRYAEAALAGELTNVREAVKGNRNNTLNTAALKLGHYIGAGLLDEADTCEDLLRAAGECGLRKREAARTIWSGMKAGKKEPWQGGEADPTRTPARVEARHGGAPEWPPLDSPQLSPLPPYPWDAMPPVLRDHAKQVAEVVQVPDEIPAFAALTVAGFSLGRLTTVSPKRGVDARGNLYCLAFVPAGERKSTTFRQVVHPLERFGRAHDDRWQGVLRERRIYEQKCQRLEKKLADPNLDPDAEEAARQHLDSLIEPAGTSPHYLAENVTQEALSQHLVNCGERAAIYSADARDVMAVLQGLYGDDRGNRESLYLAAFDGDSKRIHRIGRGEIILQRPAIGMLLMVQLDKLSELGTNRPLHDSGFLPRCILLYPDSLVGTRMWSEQEIDPDVKRRYTTAILARLERYRDQQHERRVDLTSEAKGLWVDWYNNVETALPAELADMAGQALRWQGLPLRLGLILAEYHDDHTDIEADDMSGAIDLAGYVVRHGMRVLDAMSAKLPDHLRRAVRHIRDKDMTSFVSNDLRSALRSTARKTNAMLGELADRGYVRKTGETRGAKKATVWEANPHLWEADQ